MQRHLAYQFDTTQSASRFYYNIKSGDVEVLQQRFHPDNYTVQVTYAESHCGAFDSTSSQLDELAEHHDGREVAAQL